MRTQSDEDCYRHLINSKCVFEIMLEKVKKFDYAFQAKCIPGALPQTPQGGEPPP